MDLPIYDECIDSPPIYDDINSEYRYKFKLLKIKFKKLGHKFYYIAKVIFKVMIVVLICSISGPVAPLILEVISHNNIDLYIV